MLLELELLLQRQGADGSFDTASLAPTTAGISLMVTQSASADREPRSRSTGTGIIRPGKTIRRTGVREADGTRAANGPCAAAADIPEVWCSEAMPTSSRNCSTESSLFRAAERGANSARDEGPASDGISAVTASGWRRRQRWSVAGHVPVKTSLGRRGAHG